MCGRYGQSLTWRELATLYSITADPPGEGGAPRYNIAPQATVTIVRHAEGTSRRELAAVRWGLVPHWAKDPAIGARMINARAETVAEKSAFRAAFAKRRCLVVADGFFEWQPQAKGPKQPYWIGFPNDGLYAFGGIWDAWRSAEGERLETCAIITTEPTAQLRPIHDRMPLILAENGFDTWLGAAAPVGEVRSLLAPFDAPLTLIPVSRRVNDARYDGSDVRDSLLEV